MRIFIGQSSCNYCDEDTYYYLDIEEEGGTWISRRKGARLSASGTSRDAEG